MAAEKSSKPAQKIREGSAAISLSKGVFYNPEMEFCRDISSLAVGALPSGKEKLDIVDAMCASGVRGIRYAKENANISSIVFVDSSKDACALARKNAKANSVKKAKVIEAEVNGFLYCASRDHDFGLIEIDPFGTPAPFLHSSFYAVRHRDSAFLSITATDTAVLCGAHPDACIKNYQAKPIDNEYCHELAIRILLGKIARTASDFNFGIAPLLSLSRQHFVKVLVEASKGAASAVESMKKLGYISHCFKCLTREWSFGVPKANKCPDCGSDYVHAGPLWLGELWNTGTLHTMRKLNAKRKYKSKEQLDALLALMESECPMPPTYFDLHKVCETMGVSAVRLDTVIENLRAAGFRVSKTHFRLNSIRTDAKIGNIRKAIKSALSAPSRPRRE
jgi:tRNA (guanine26-N2/guanine27-N2)-dimethyltransferase